MEIRRAGSAFLLERFTSEAKFVADTWHRSLAEAMQQAHVEYEIRGEDWHELDD